jgi:hypothetical protein
VHRELALHRARVGPVPEADAQRRDQDAVEIEAPIRASRLAHARAGAARECLGRGDLWIHAERLRGLVALDVRRRG